MFPDIAHNRPSSFPPRHLTHRLTRQRGSTPHTAGLRKKPTLVQAPSRPPTRSLIVCARLTPPSLRASLPLRTHEKPTAHGAGLPYSHLRTATVPPALPLRCMAVMPVATRAARTPVALRVAAGSLRRAWGVRAGCTRFATLWLAPPWASCRTRERPEKIVLCNVSKPFKMLIGKQLGACPQTPEHDSDGKTTLTKR